MIKEHQFTYSLATIDDFVAQIWNQFKSYYVWTFSGNLGAGKTTFISHLCQFLGTDEIASSPTYALVNEYSFKDDKGKDIIIYHADWYRINGVEEAYISGLEEYFNVNGAYSFIEWAENAASIIPKPAVHLKFEILENMERKLYITLD